VIVADASAIVEMLLDPRIATCIYEAFGPQDIHAPHILDLEVLSVFRRYDRLRQLTAETIADALGNFRALVITRHRHNELLDRVWELRDNLTTYDAAYVALAERLDAPLVTTDARLARSSGHRATIELLAR